MTDAMFSFSTIELMATHSGSSRAVTVGARFPGVIFAAISRSFRAMLYWQRMYFCAATYGKLNCPGREKESLTYNPFYSGRNQVDELLVRGVFRFDEGG